MNIHSTQVGACIVDRKNGQIVGIGYNSMPKDKDFTWKGASSRTEENSIKPGLKYAYGKYLKERFEKSLSIIKKEIIKLFSI